MNYVLHEPLIRPAGELFRRIAEHPFDRWARVDDALVGEHQHDPLSAFLDHGPKAVLAPLKHLRGPLAFGYVHDRADILNQLTRSGKHRMGHVMAVSYRSIRTDNPILELIGVCCARRPVFHCFEQGPVLGVNTVDECIIVRHLEQYFPRRAFLICTRAGRSVVIGAQAEDSEQLRRDKGNSRGHVADEAADMTEPLRLL